jgi:hypothetical protein
VSDLQGNAARVQTAREKASEAARKARDPRKPLRGKQVKKELMVSKDAFRAKREIQKINMLCLNFSKDAAARLRKSAVGAEVKKERDVYLHVLCEDP